MGNASPEGAAAARAEVDMDFLTKVFSSFSLEERPAIPQPGYVAIYHNRYNMLPDSCFKSGKRVGSLKCSTKMKQIFAGILHHSVQFGDMEVMYVGGAKPENSWVKKGPGVYEHEPHKPGGKFVFLDTTLVGSFLWGWNEQRKLAELGSTFGLRMYNRYEHNCLHFVREALNIVGGEVSDWHFRGMTVGYHSDKLVGLMNCSSPAAFEEEELVVDKVTIDADNSVLSTAYYSSDEGTSSADISPLRLHLAQEGVMCSPKGHLSSLSCLTVSKKGTDVESLVKSFFKPGVVAITVTRMKPTKVNSGFVSYLAAQLLEHYDAAAESALCGSVYDKSIESISEKIKQQIAGNDRSYTFTEMALEVGEDHRPHNTRYAQAYENLQSRFPVQLNKKRDTHKRGNSEPPTPNRDESAPSSKPVRKKPDLGKRPNSEPPSPNKVELAPRKLLLS